MPRRTVFAVSCLLALSCNDADVDCTCNVEIADARRILACGESACLAGTRVSCAGDGTSALAGTCAAEPENPSPDVPPPTPTPTAPPDTRCADLLRFCDTACRSPAAVALDCRSTASNGVPDACAAWSLGSGVLCRP